MNTLEVFGAQLVMSLIVLSMLAKRSIAPWLSVKLSYTRYDYFEASSSLG